MKHVWKKLTNGDIDEFVLDVEAETTGHNGPGCEVCGFYFCIHCPDAEANWESECPKEC